MIPSTQTNPAAIVTRFGLSSRFGFGDLGGSGLAGIILASLREVNNHVST
jgi:hypothetical protein